MVLRFDLDQLRYIIVDEGMIVSENGIPFYTGDLSTQLRPGDRLFLLLISNMRKAAEIYGVCLTMLEPLQRCLWQLHW